MPDAPIRDIELYYERAGAGEPLLFISGTGGDLRVKPNVFDGPFAKTFDLLAYDQRGLGRSSKPDRSYTMADYADDASGPAGPRRLGIRRSMVGVSFGGMVAQELALRHPEKVRRLVLACTSPGGEGGSSYPFHEIGHLTGEARARHLLPISDTPPRRGLGARPSGRLRRDDRFRLNADPYADEPGHRAGRRAADRGAGGARYLEPPSRHRLSSFDRRRRLRWHRTSSYPTRNGRSHPKIETRGIRGRPPLHAARPPRSPDDDRISANLIYGRHDFLTLCKEDIEDVRMPTATMTSKGQITVPAATRARLRLEPGTRVDFVETPEGDVLMKPVRGDIRRLYGIVKYGGPPISIEDMDQAIGDQVMEDFTRSVS